MSNFVPRRINAPYDFEITHNPHGHWTALDRGGLTGGTFLTRKDAMRFALSETGGDRRHHFRIVVAQFALSDVSGHESIVAKRATKCYKLGVEGTIRTHGAPCVP